MMNLILEIGAIWLVAILGGFPLYASMGLAAFAFVYTSGLPPLIVAQKMVQGANSFPIVAAPIFILMGNILTGARINDRIVAFATALVGWLRGGYAHASIVASMIFAGMVGSAVADAAGVGSIEIKSMRRVGYRPETAAAITAAAATIGPIIPPSLPMVIYGVAADVSIGRLFVGGFIPGILMGVSLMAMVAVIAKAEGFARQPFAGFREIWRTFRDGFWALMAPVLLLGGMFSGYFTPTEAAAVAALYALFLGLVVYRTLEWKHAAKNSRRQRRDHWHRAGAGDGGRRDGLVHVDLARAADRDAADGADHRQSGRVPDRVQPHLAAGRLLHGIACGDADPDSDPGAGGDRFRRRPGAFRRDDDPEPDPRHHSSADRRRAVHHLADRRHQL